RVQHHDLDLGSGLSQTGGEVQEDAFHPAAREAWQHERNVRPAHLGALTMRESSRASSVIVAMLTIARQRRDSDTVMLGPLTGRLGRAEWVAQPAEKHISLRSCRGAALATEGGWTW